MDAILFDINGVLVRWEKPIASLIQFVPEKNKDINIISKYLRGYLSEILTYDEFCEKIGITKKKEAIEKYVTHASLAEDYHSIIKDLKKEYKISIVSNMPKEMYNPAVQLK